ncbi:uncharacterized protein LOC110464667 [Mizuhopecten yessoensis]|uniref:uncharacterized protein LOC110464667 n=1 Tax=Mizuhopecten yessoensis TaxID=6573 RepID=UPI000B45946F|nr:uncharacterized protein LOC110464667 [Mizuhopecten yessoensis]
MTAATWLLQLTCMLTISSTLTESMETKTIQTPSGKMMGLKVDITTLNSFVYQFRRIPYAKPPIGDLRFAKPQPMAPWTDTLNATYFGPNCMQTIINPDDPLLPNKTLSEDCLVLNVYVPPNTTESSKKPVILYIHGGSYIAGAGMLYDGSCLAIYGDQVVVTINYRLGIWGFLTTGDSNCPGNFGLWDQRLAMQWAKANIQAFGGDPDLITIFGESAGGFSVAIHSISPINKGLFKRAMSHSGTANSFFAVAQSKLAKLAQIGMGLFVKCFDVENSAKFLQCMRTKSSQELLVVSVNVANITFNDIHHLHYALPLAPVVDGEFITENPAKILNDPTSPGMQFFRSLDYVDGDVNSEGSLLFLEPLYSFQKPNHFNISEGIPYRILCDDVIETIVKEFFNNNRTLRYVACSRYKSASGDGVDQSRLAVNLFSDIFFFTPGVLTLNAHAGGTRSTYQWLFSRKSKYGFGFPYPKWFTGAGHAGELAFLFGIIRDPDTGPSDKILAEQMMSYWSNFARTGNPNTGLAVKVQWPEYNVQDGRYISLNATISSEEGLYKDIIDFWVSVLPKAYYPRVTSQSGLEDTNTCLCGEGIRSNLTMTGATWLLQLTCILTIASTLTESMETKTIQTPSGKMMGLKVDITTLNSFVYQFRRIPYAKPPVGDLRFAKPQPMAPWTDTLNATYFGPNCMQTIINPDDPLLPNKILSEDCLVLNVYVPPNTTESSKKPVMLYIHGGSYVEGTGMFYDGSYLSIHGDQLVVTINYRLGIWGFLTTGDSNCPGNFGLWDQRLAMQWAKANIQAFGGDPNLITIFGESAGGFSVAIHSISPINKGLFKRAMSHSGTANSFFAVAQSKLAKYSQIGMGLFVKCFDVENSAKFLQCMRTKSSQELLEVSVNVANITFSDKHHLHFALPLAPVVDGEFITENPAKILNDPLSPGMQFFRSLDYVDGDVNSEGSLLFQEPLYSFQKPNHFNISEGIPYRILCDDVIETIVKEFFNNNRTLRYVACSRYKSASGDGVDQSRLAVNLYTDIFFFTPGVLTLNAHVGGIGRTYQWLLSRKSKYGFGFPYPKWFTGAGHAGEVAFLFGIIRYPDIGSLDKNLAEQMMSYWSNFARTGNPNTGLAVKVQWPEYNVQDGRYISLNTTISTEERLYKDRVDFWASVLPKA